MHSQIRRRKDSCSSYDPPELPSRELQALLALANKGFKVVVSCLTVWRIGQASTGLVYLKTAVSCDKTSWCYDAIFDSVALVSWMRLWLQLFIHIQICIQADVLIRWINKTFQVFSPVSNCCQPQTVNAAIMCFSIDFITVLVPCNSLSFFLYFLFY